MEFAEGGELFDHIIKNRRVDEKRGAKLLQQILSGLEYLHKLNISHRSVFKPGTSSRRIAYWTATRTSKS